MKPFLPLLASLLFLPACTPDHSETADQQARHARIDAQITADEKAETQLKQDYRPPGRFQIASHQFRDQATKAQYSVMLKLDTVTGETWSYESSAVQNPAADYSLVAYGWKPVSTLSNEIAELRQLRIITNHGQLELQPVR